MIEQLRNFRDGRQIKRDEKRKGKAYERPLREPDRAPVARFLLDQIKEYLFEAPEYQRALCERKAILKVNPHLAEEYSTVPIEFDNEEGHFAVLKVESKSPRIHVESCEIYVCPKIDGETRGDKKIEIKVSLESNESLSEGLHGHEALVLPPSFIGDFSLVNPGGLEDADLMPNSQQTKDAIRAILPKLFPNLANNLKNGVSRQ